MPIGTGRIVAGRYILEEPIGQGAMGIVWRAYDQLLDRPVAVKEVLVSAMLGEFHDGDPYQRTMDEARNAARLNHPGIVTVFDAVEEDERPWIVMELIPSTSLDQLINTQGPMNERRAARIGSQLLAALAAAHAAGVLHRDVKPGNVLITEDSPGENPPERAVLTDFGISRLETDPRRTLAGLVVGSPGYVAPERLSGDDASPASDLWSLGATLYAAVEGRGPFDRPNVMSTQFAVVNEEPPPALSAGLLAPVIAALLSRDPAMRPSAAAAADLLAQALRQMDHPAPLAAPTSAEQIHPAEQFPSAGLVSADEADEAELTGSRSRRRTRTAPDGPLAADEAASDDRAPGTQTLARARPRRTRASYRRGGQRIRLTIPLVLAAIVIAAVAGGVLWSLRPTSTEKLRSTSAGGSATPTPTATAAVPAKDLPPVSGAPTVVQEIDQPASALPAGYVTQTVPAPPGPSSRGFAIGIPSGWQAQAMGQQTYQYSPEGGVTYLEIDLSRHVTSSMVAEAEYLKAADRDLYPGYQPINGPRKKDIQRENILQTDGAVWQFDWVNKGVRMRVDVLLFNLGHQSYTITMTGPAGPSDANWNNNILGTMTKMLRTFRSIA
jgi:serine/threonine protein kinase